MTASIRNLQKRVTALEAAGRPRAEVEGAASSTREQRFRGRRVLVTGGAQGIGLGVAEAFAAEGATVLVADIQSPPPESRATALHCDVRSPADIERCCRRAGDVDVLVNNVAVQPHGACHDQELAEWDRAIATNLTSYFLFAKYTLPYMLSIQRGAIVNIASVQGSQSMPGIPGYAASKGGILSLTRQLGVEYASRGVRVNSVSPGSVQTPLLERNLRLNDKTLNDAGAAYPIKRVGTVEEVAKVVLFLASDDASFIVGENIHVDGGIMALGCWATNG